MSKLDDNDDTVITDEDVYIGYRRPEVEKQKQVDDKDDISDDIKWKLFLIRQIALLKFREQSKGS